MIVRAEQAGDAAAISSLITEVFAGAAHSSGTEAAIVEALRAAGALTVSLVADDDTGIIGQVAFSPVTIDGVADGWFGLGPIAVRPDRQRDGIGRLLIEQGLAMIRADGARGCVLLGDPGYYCRFGFAADPALYFPGVPPEYFQCLSFDGSVPHGTIAFHPAFDAS